LFQDYSFYLAPSIKNDALLKEVITSANGTFVKHQPHNVSENIVVASVEDNDIFETLASVAYLNTVNWLMVFYNKI